MLNPTDRLESAEVCTFLVGSDGSVVWANAVGHQRAPQCVGGTLASALVKTGIPGSTVGEIRTAVETGVDNRWSVARGTIELSAMVVPAVGGAQQMLCTAVLGAAPGAATEPDFRTSLQHQAGELPVGNQRSDYADAVAEAELEREFMFAVFDAPTTLVMVVDASGSIVRFNTACQQVAGWTAEEALGRSYVDLSGPDAHSGGSVDDLVRGDASRTEQEETWKRADGAVRYVKWLNSAVRDRQGQVQFVVRVGHDVTAAHATEAALQASREQFELCLAAQNDGIWDYEVNAPDAFYSDRWFEMLGYTPGELKAEPALFRKLLHPDDFPRVDAAMRAYAERRTSTYELEVRCLHKDGTYRWILTRGAGRFDAEGRLVRMVGSHTDIHARKSAEAALKQSEARLAEAQSLAHVGAWSIETVSGKIDWSDELYILHGRDKDLGPPTLNELTSLVLDEDRHLFDDAMVAEKWIRGDYPRHYRIRRPDGAIRHVQLQARPQYSESGVYQGLIGSAQDVTDQTIAAQALARSQALLLESQRIAKIGSWEVDVRSRSLTCTPQTLEILGWKRETSATLLQLARQVRQEDHARLRRLYRRAVLHQEPIDADVGILGADGGTVTLHLLAKPQVNSAGKVTRIIGSVQDVTAIREADRQLAAQRAFLRRILDTNPNLICVRDSERRFVAANEAFASVHGTTVADLLGKRYTDINPDPARAEEFESHDLVVLESGESEMYQERITDVRGRVGWYQTFVRPIIEPESGEVQILSVSADISERVRIQHELEAAREAALGASRMKSEFLANMSHEIRTPLNGVLGMAQLLADTPLNDDQGLLLRTLTESGRGLLAILNDILDLSKMEAGKMSIEWSDVDVIPLIEDVAALFMAQIESKSIELKLCIDWSDRGMLRTDPVRLRQILANLVGNAVKFTDTGSVEIGMVSLPDNGLRIYVKDTGVGIPEDRQQAIFESFTQADGSTTRRFGGTGLGLSIARQLAELLSGDISVQSVEGVGSTFSIDFASSVRSLRARTRVLRNCKLDVRISDRQTGEYVRACLVREGANLTDSAADVTIADDLHPDLNPATTVAILRRGEPNAIPAAALLHRPVHSRHLIAAVRSVLSQHRTETTDVALPDSQTILLAEDNEVNRTVARRVLEGFGLNIITVESGRLAYETFTREHVDLVFMDIQMPDWNGLEATARIREWEAVRGTRVPIIAMTAHALTEDRARCIAGGMDDYISKPIRKEELREKLERWLQSDKHMSKQIDLTYLIEIAGDDLEFQQDVLSAYAEALPPMLKELEDAAVRGDRDTAGRVVHTLKGSSRSIGATQFALICESAEMECKHGDLIAAARQVASAAMPVLQECESFIPAN